MSREFTTLHRQITSCSLCPRLRSHCQTVAREKRRAYADDDYWGKPVPGFGDPQAALWIVGLAPGAHGANRTGRVFTGDRSGDFLFAALHRAGFASQPNSTARDDGLALRNCYISAAVRCAPPGNKPLPVEASSCASFLDAEWRLLRNKRAILALGKIAWDAVVALGQRNGWNGPRPPFAHGHRVALTDTLSLIGSYHVSQQNTFTGRLTPGMFDAVLREVLIVPR
jgi:uracil-DNA glycosylase family 4